MKKNVKINKATGIVTWEEGGRIEAKYPHELTIIDLIDLMEAQYQEECIEIECEQLGILMPL